MNKERFCSHVVATTLLFLAVATNTLAARDHVTVKVGKRAQLIEGGQAVLVKMRAACEPGLEVLEAHVTVEDQFGFFSLPCDGRPQKFEVRVEHLDGAFEPGEAFASAFVLVEDPETGDTVQAQDSRQITIRDRVTVKIGKRAELIEGRQAVLVKIRAACGPGLEVLEAFVTVQDQFGFFPLPCDGRPQKFEVRVEHLDGAFEPGKAFASALVLVEDPETGDTAQAQDTRPIRIRD